MLLRKLFVRQNRELRPSGHREPLRVVIAAAQCGDPLDSLLVDLFRHIDRTRFQPEFHWLGAPHQVPDALAEIAVMRKSATHLPCTPANTLRTIREFSSRRIDAVVALGIDVHSLWSRWAAWCACVPAVISVVAGDRPWFRLGRLNRLTKGCTDAFVGMAESHARYLAIQERLPADKVYVIGNGVDASEFAPRESRATLEWMDVPLHAPVVGTVTPLEPDKNVDLFLRVATLVRIHVPSTRFIISGNGSEHEKLVRIASRWGLADSVHFVDAKECSPDLLSAIDVFLLTSRQATSPVAILRAMACETPVVASRVGFLSDMVQHAETGYLGDPGNAEQIAGYVVRLLRDRSHAAAMGKVARRWVRARASVERMVAGYQDLLAGIYDSKCTQSANSRVNVHDLTHRSIPEPETPEQYTPTARS